MANIHNIVRILSDRVRSDNPEELLEPSHKDPEIADELYEILKDLVNGNSRIHKESFLALEDEDDNFEEDPLCRVDDDKEVAVSKDEENSWTQECILDVREAQSPVTQSFSLNYMKKVVSSIPLPKS